MNRTALDTSVEISDTNVFTLVNFYDEYNIHIDSGKICVDYQLRLDLSS